MTPEKVGLGPVEFDEYADPDAYNAALEQGIALSGEDKSYFARGRVAWLAGILRSQDFRPLHVLDFGCGTGTATPFLLELIGPAHLIGVDLSARSIETARRLHGSDRTRFLTIGEYEPLGEIDLVFCNGVFHHIPLADRAAAVDYLARALRPGGLFACWENNPWNPGTRLVMRRIPFDRDAITLSPPQARRLMVSGGLEILRTDFLFFFPRSLSIFRSLEPRLSKFPLGAQYQVLCQNSGQSSSRGSIYMAADTLKSTICGTDPPS
jgi:SAM-dependent methyltransferase